MRPSMKAGRFASYFAASLAIGLLAAGSAQASVISATPTLPLFGVPYSSPGGGCFPAVSLCVQSVSFTLVPGPDFMDSFSGGNEFITTDVTATSVLVDPAHVTHIVPVTGTLSQEIIGRTTDTETGSWSTVITAMSLSGTFLGHPLDAVIDPDPSRESTGTTSIDPLGGNKQDFRIDSFFDVFVDLTLEGTGLMTERGPIPATAGVPEPAGVALLAIPILALGAFRRRV